MLCVFLRSFPLFVPSFVPSFVRSFVPSLVGNEFSAAVDSFFSVFVARLCRSVDLRCCVVGCFFVLCYTSKDHTTQRDPVIHQRDTFCLRVRIASTARDNYITTHGTNKYTASLCDGLWQGTTRGKAQGRRACCLYYAHAVCTT